jgi:signal transduction histidine kinase
VFQNLIGNAIKYRGAEVPTAHVSAAKGDGGEWIFSVRDNGPGIEAAFLESVFTPFERLHNKERWGAGLGLSICRAIVERHGGRIWAESQPEGGATLCFTLPAD